MQKSAPTGKSSKAVSNPKQQLDSFLDKFSPEIAAEGRRILAKMRKRLPNAVELVYDNYNALACGFGPSEKSSEAIFSIALFPRWVSLFFLQGATLPDPDHLLKGSGNVVRHIVLGSAADLDKPEIRSLMDQALRRARVPIHASTRRQLIIRSVSAKQRPRRPTPKSK